MITTMDYGHPEKAFFQKSWTFGLGQTFWAEIFWGIWGIFGWTISTTVSSLSMIFIIQPLFLQKTKPSYPTSKYLFRIAYLLFWMNDNYHWPYIFPKEVIMVKMLTCEPNWAFSFYLFHVIYFTWSISRDLLHVKITFSIKLLILFYKMTSE